MRENGLREVHSKLNESFNRMRDNAQESRLNSIICSQLVDFNEIVMSDYRGFLFNIDFRELF